MISETFKKKTTYALKTPRVVALLFIYGVEYILISNQKSEKITSSDPAVLITSLSQRSC